MENDNTTTIISRLIDSKDIPILVFFGAGAGYSTSVDESLRLPLGNTLRDRLLKKRYPNIKPSKKRITKFYEDYKLHATPDIVWHKLISDRNKLSDYYPILSDCFSPDKPVPSSYYMLARWFYSSEYCSMATTNFDGKINSAFKSVGKSINKIVGRDYYIPSVEKDYSFYSESVVQPGKIVQKLHGTIDMPWSIVAGFENRDEEFLPYKQLKEVLKKTAYWIFIGYSFGDDYLFETILDSYKDGSNPTICVIDTNPEPYQKLITGCAKAKKGSEPEAIYAETEAETFLKQLITAQLNKLELPPIMLPDRERDTLRVGPKFIPGCSGRILSKSEDGDKTLFKDNVYGDFTFSDEIEDEIIRYIDTGELQRLRYIKQLSFVHLKHPGATHDRFTHTLGVAHLADRAYKVLEKKYGNKTNYQHIFNTKSYKSLVLSSLFHDTGHGPLGHTMDQVRRRYKIDGSHEQDSVRMFRNAVEINRAFADLDIARADSEISSNDVLQLMEGKHPLSELISNPGVDLDRIDFLLRDSYATLYSLQAPSASEDWYEHLTNISTNIDNIIDSIVLIKSDKENSWHIAFNPEARPIISEMAKLYAFMYDNVYYCWQNNSAQTMISIAIEEVLKSHKYSWSDILQLTDIEMFSILENFENPLIQELAYLVKYRRLFEKFDEVEYSGNIALNEDDFYNENIIDPKDKFSVLTSIKKPKYFSVRFSESDLFDEQKIAEPEKLSYSKGRITFYRWPGNKNLIDNKKDYITHFLKEKGAEEIIWRRD